MYELGQEVIVITDKGIAYNGYVLARATASDGKKAYKVSIHGGGVEQTGNWHKESDIFTIDPDSSVELPPTESLQTIVEEIQKS
jgi:hypothetical protein